MAVWLNIDLPNLNTDGNTIHKPDCYYVKKFANNNSRWKRVGTPLGRNGGWLVQYRSRRN